MRYRELTVKMVSLFITPDLVYTALIRHIPGIGLLKLPVDVMNTGLAAYLIKRAHPILCVPDSWQKIVWNLCNQQNRNTVCKPGIELPRYFYRNKDKYATGVLVTLAGSCIPWTVKNGCPGFSAAKTFRHGTDKNIKSLIRYNLFPLRFCHGKKKALPPFLWKWFDYASCVIWQYVDGV